MFTSCIEFVRWCFVYYPLTIGDTTDTVTFYNNCGLFEFCDRSKLFNFQLVLKKYRIFCQIYANKTTCTFDNNLNVRMVLTYSYCKLYVHSTTGFLLICIALNYNVCSVMFFIIVLSQI